MNGSAGRGDGGVLGEHGYGKSGIRLLGMLGDAGVDGLVDLTVAVRLSGGADDAYLAGDNAHMVTTDGQRNLVTAVVGRLLPAAVEDVALAIVAELSHCYPFVRRVEVSIEQRLWARASGWDADPPRAGSAQGGAAFALDSCERRVVRALADGGPVQLWQGLAGITLLLTAGSAFEGFVVDGYTTNVAHHSRPIAGRLAARWRGRAASQDWARTRDVVRRSLVDAFASERSNSLQHLLTSMGRRALEAGDLVEIELGLESVQLAPVDERFGPAAPERLFDVVDTPFGDLHVTVEREPPAP
ncbi:MAG TPA: hypothetical protein VND23_06775 [Acidimicrobiales bacterium]|nr:hypothetical protein [Acidimicrobiales bacterium]